MKCPHCDKQISDDSKFCMFCGEEIVEEEPEEKEESVSVKCEKCGAEVRKEAKFCPVCGNKLVEEKIFCPRCGKENSYDANYCVVCNYSLERHKKRTIPQENQLVPAVKANKKMEPSVILGIISICVVIITCMIPFVSSIAGIILGIIGLTKALKSETGESKNIATTLVVYIKTLIFDNIYF